MSLRSEKEDFITYERIEIKDESSNESIKESMRRYMAGSDLAGENLREKRSEHKAPFPERVEYDYSARDFAKKHEQQSEMFSDYIKILGQVGASFVLCTRGDSLLLIDQHAAHERILFDNLKRMYDEKKVSPQPLLIPIVIELSKSDALMLESYLDELNGIGFLIEPFGRNSYAVKEVPDLLLGYNYKDIVHDMISDLMFLEKSGNLTERVTSLMKLLSCKGAIKANRRLTDTEIIRLLQDMAVTDFPTNCPHGRPVVIELSQKDIRKMFKRL